MADSRADDIIRRQDQLRSARGNWESLWQEVADRVWPQMSDFLSKREPGAKRTEKIFDSTACLALEKFAAAIHSLITPDNQQYHGLTPGDKSLQEYHPLKQYLEDVTEALFAVRRSPFANFRGASSWISVGPIFFQPSEVMKLAAVIYASAWLAAKDSFRSFGESVGPMFAVVGLGALLILWQPDFGTMVTLLGTVFLLSFSSGVPLKWIVGIGVAGLVGLLLLVKIEPYRLERLLTFLNPSTDPQGAGYQVLQGLLAIGSGGLWGLGYGLSRQKYNYLPEVLGDSFFAVVAEELGFVRALLILAIFLLLFLRGLRIAGEAPDKFSKNLALGVVALFSVQFFVNMGAVLGLLPLTGVPLPFFSYGSSALIVNLCALGILLNVSRDVKLK